MMLTILPYLLFIICCYITFGCLYPIVMNVKLGLENKAFTVHVYVLIITGIAITALLELNKKEIKEYDKGYKAGISQQFKIVIKSNTTYIKK